VFQEEPIDVVWKFDPEAAKDARHFRFHPTQEMEELGDGSLLVRFRAGGKLEMCWHLFTWGEHVEVVEPGEFRGVLGEELRTAARAL
jgi:predicted DNA-binding transcriptional regulator YafY